jgi:hypothetical protein
MPITLGGGYENLMIINLNDRVSITSPEKMKATPNSFNRLSSVLKVTPNKTEEKVDSKDTSLAHAKFSILGTQRLEHLPNLTTSHCKEGPVLNNT